MNIKIYKYTSHPQMTAPSGQKKKFANRILLTYMKVEIML